jgi:DNA sulfur modification protein DndD
MQLSKLTLENFRQFRDEEIEFARDEKANITVVHGANGSGKTTLLNAFTWLLYEDVNFGMRPQRLASEGAMAAASPGEEVTVSVGLSFTHDGADYRTLRRARYEKQSASDLDGRLVDDPELIVEYEDENGVQKPNNPENHLSRIIPERLSDLFFFDGEDIDELAGIDNQDQIQEAIENIMGLTILERATRHLGTVANRFESQVQESASEELRKLIDEKRDVEDAIEELERKRKDKKRAISRVETEISDIEDELKAFEDSARLQKQRDKLRDEKREFEKDVKQINDDIKSAIKENGFVPLAMPLIRETAEDIDQLREEGVIPSELSDDFLDSLLDAGQCICGRDLEEHSDPYQHVASLRGEAASDGVEEGALRIIGHLQEFSDRRTDFFEEIDKLIERRQDKFEEIRRREERIDDISTELKELDGPTKEGVSIKDREDQREEKEREKEQLIEDKGRIQEKISAKEETLKQIEEQITKQREEREETRLAQRRQRAAEAVENQLSENFDQLKGRVREWSNEEVKQTFDEIATKEMEAEITDDFELKIRQSVDDRKSEVDKSMGERQIASLAFIGSLVKIARKRYEADSESEYFTGGIYPIVMDSPFGALDNNHRRQVSRVLPTLASQVVVFATDGQWEGPVEDEMSDIVGKQYWLEFDDGGGENNSPRTRIRTEQTAAAGD